MAMIFSFAPVRNTAGGGGGCDHQQAHGCTKTDAVQGGAVALPSMEAMQVDVAGVDTGRIPWYL